MENKEIKQYLINFVEKTLNECEVFKKVYGVDFVRKKLETNLENVYINISNCNSNTALYDMENSSITIFSNKPLDILDIELAQKTENISEEIMQHFYDLVFCINGGETIASKDFTSRLALKFKNQIYLEILKRYQKEIVEQIKNSRQAKNEDEKIDLPVPYKKSWFQRLKEAIKS